MVARGPGKFALVAHLIKAPRLLHLRTLTWLAECPRSATGYVRAIIAANLQD